MNASSLTVLSAIVGLTVAFAESSKAATPPTQRAPTIIDDGVTFSSGRVYSAAEFVDLGAGQTADRILYEPSSSVRRHFGTRLRGEEFDPEFLEEIVTAIAGKVQNRSETRTRRAMGLGAVELVAELLTWPSVSPEVREAALLQMFSPPWIEWNPRLRPDEPFVVRTHAGPSSLSDLPFHVRSRVRRLRVDGQTLCSSTCGFLRSGGISCDSLPEVDDDQHFEVDVEWLILTNASVAPRADGALGTWLSLAFDEPSTAGPGRELDTLHGIAARGTRTLGGTVKRLQPGESPRAGVHDSELRTRIASLFRVKSAVVAPDDATEGVVATVELEMIGKPVEGAPIIAIPVVSIGDHQFRFDAIRRGQTGDRQWSTGSLRFVMRLESLPQDVRRFDLVLEPDLAAEAVPVRSRAGSTRTVQDTERAWGEPIYFENVAVTRSDLTTAR